MRSASFIGVVAFLVLLIGGAVGVYAYDKSREDRIAKGVRVGDVPVGGLEREDAAAKLRDELATPLSEPLTVAVAGRRFHLTAKTAELEVDVDASVEEAVRRSRSGNILARAARELTGGSVDAQVEPTVSYDRDAVDDLVARIRRSVERKPQDAKVEFATAGLEKVDSRDGLRIDGARLRRRVEAALVRPGPRGVAQRVKRIPAKVTTEELADKYDTVITIDRGGFTLRLFKRLKLVRTYPIALGQAGLETPAGLYNIQNKAVNPAWNVPNSDWAGDLAGTVVPGGVPENPLKARWLGVYDGVGIHGTAERGSIGTNASHGCIRMLVEDVIELYDQVPVGAAIYIA